MKKPLSLFFDALIVFWAACGVLLAFGSGALLAMIKSAARGKNPLPSAGPAMAKAKRLLSMIFMATRRRK